MTRFIPLSASYGWAEASGSTARLVDFDLGSPVDQFSPRSRHGFFVPDLSFNGSVTSSYCLRPEYVRHVADAVFFLVLPCNIFFPYPLLLCHMHLFFFGVRHIQVLQKVTRSFFDR